MFLKRILLTCVTAFSFAACSSPYPFNYAPSNLTRGSGTVRVDTFAYSPASRHEVAPNEIQKPGAALGSFSFQKPIGEIVADALRKEFRMSGFGLSSDAPVRVTGSVERFHADWIGVSTFTVEMDISFVAHRRDSLIYQQAFRSRQQTPKFAGERIEPFKAALSDCLDQFIRDAVSKGVLK